MNTPRENAGLIHKWADGAQIQMCIGGGWVDSEPPRWRAGVKYRVKPEPKPDVVRFMVCVGHISFKTFDEAARITKSHDRSWIVKVVIDGETGARKSAEVVS